MSRSAVATQVDRRSRYLRLTTCPTGNRADQVVTHCGPPSGASPPATVSS